ncbi:hypothetical protein [Pseudoalteromonas sp. T1lg88]|uniref:hypothetical protein n=1 Tax=Pseudoalteromonas sp. T1lg88 TaxID=2077104 RepID=UPI000CF742CF|nr:hypothetical protein [Pseudoalteromonas sp. T1lg88]
MPIKSNMNGLKKFTENVKQLQGNHLVKFLDVMSPEFISGCSPFKNLDELFAASGFKIESKEDLEAVPSDEWEHFIVTTTTFESWEEMQRQAVAAYVKKQLSKGL